MPAADTLRHAPSASGTGRTGPVVRSCRHCGLAQRLPALAPGLAARCRRCGAPLRRTWADPLSLGLVLGVACVVLFAAAATNDLAVVQSMGRTRTADLLASPTAMVQQGLWPLGALVFLTSTAAPLLVSLLTVYVLGGVRLRRAPPGLAAAFKLRNRLRPWSMIEVFLVGYFVAYSKLGALAQIEPGAGFYALFGFMLATVATDAVLDPQAVWEAIARRAPALTLQLVQAAPAVLPGLVCCSACELACEAPGGGRSRCPRCGEALHRRKPASLARTAALTLSALVLYVPANVFPVLTVIQVGQGAPSTILSGVWELAAGGDWSLAAIVFGASIAVPVLKILGLGAMLVVAARGRRGQAHCEPGHLRQVTALYRVVALIGRWSMIDIFMEAFLSALVQFGAVSTVTTEPGALAFAATVLLTIFAAECFDPRLMWDAAAR